MIYFYLGDIMSFDGVFLSKILDEISFLKTGRISKILESGDTDFIFTVRSQGKNHNLMLSFSSLYSRIHLHHHASKIQWFYMIHLLKSY